MPTERLFMRKCREILRSHFELGMSNRQISRMLSISPATVFYCLARAEGAGLGWPLPDDLDDTALEAKLYPPPDPIVPRAPVDWATIHQELRRKGVTLFLLWQEYKAIHAQNGYQYSRFCDMYSKFAQKLDVSMRQVHRAGEKMFTDFSGDGIPITDPITGQIRYAPLFVAILGASNYTYAEAFESQDLQSWIQGHIHAFEFFQGVPQMVVPDNPKTAVTTPCRYEPLLNQTYLDMANHYHTAIVPARVRKPKDKAKVENAVLIVQRWILAALRNHTFFSLQQANLAIAEKLQDLNHRKFQKLDTSRKQLFESLDKPALQPLPPSRYQYADWIPRTVNIDYHIEVDRHYYSVPYQLVREKVEARVTTATVEVFFKGKRVASHLRSFNPSTHTTCPEHMPRSHREYLQWTPSRILDWAQKSGPYTRELTQKIIDSRKYPELAYRSCLGILRLGKSYTEPRLEAACQRALAIGSASYKSVKSILSENLDKLPLPENQNRVQLLLPKHENLRGPDYYQ